VEAHLGDAGGGGDDRRDGAGKALQLVDADVGDATAGEELKRRVAVLVVI
jgi:hypothetical protein